jgi:hypothetical protein
LRLKVEQAKVDMFHVLGRSTANSIIRSLRATKRIPDHNFISERECFVSLRSHVITTKEDPSTPVIKQGKKESFFDQVLPQSRMFFEICQKLKQFLLSKCPLSVRSKMRHIIQVLWLCFHAFPISQGFLIQNGFKPKGHHKRTIQLSALTGELTLLPSTHSSSFILL